MARKNSNVIFYVTLIIIALCGFCIWTFSGINHEDAKFNMILLAFLAVTVLQILVYTPIKYTIMSIDAACWPDHQPPVTPDKNAKVETLMDKVRLRLRRLKSELMITESHRNEQLNLRYRLLEGELVLTGMLFLIIFGMAMVLIDQLLYFNTEAVENLFELDRKYEVGLSQMITLPEVYTFIELCLIMAFTDESNTGHGAPWIHAEPARMLGVVRLKQLRTENRRVGLNKPVFTDKDFSEGWLPYKKAPYTDKYWPIYEPWMSGVYSIQEKLMGDTYHGHYITYPEAEGYQTLLSDTRRKSQMILQYLKEKKWLDYNTSALFMDFTLYNADANIFSVCRLWIEQLPFGNIHSHIDIDSEIFVEQLRHMSSLGMIVLFTFVIVWLQFAKVFFVKVWFEPRLLKTLWIQVDALIIILTLLVSVILGIRDNLIQSMLEKIEICVLVEFIDFRKPERLTFFADILKGFSIALVTMRLWKVMQFSGTFQLFTKSFAMAWQALIWTTVVTIIFIVAIALVNVTINGSHIYNFMDLTKGVVTVSCFAFGFTDVVDPTDLFFGGDLMGIILYAVMGLVAKYLLINLIISMMRDQMAIAKADRDRKVLHRISFWQFLRVEYADCINFILKVAHLKKRYYRENRTVAENIDRKVKHQDRMAEIMNISQHHPKIIPEKQRDEELLQLRYRERIERTMTMGAILQTQMELFERLMFGDEDGKLPSLDAAEENVPSTQEA
ncbi:polycystin-2-like [Drosophila biarmipes]|uniref:polycystin-2-like n=1 Tax=Drosophila biarmipes TaxID=125945 RepID=UPI0021CCF0F7|nr:polycystin-2-like [Drosophila biarmipes]